jgi:hypothetical protein
VKQSENPERLRAALTAFRDADLGTGIVDQVFLCKVPVAKSTFMRRWDVLGSVKLRVL